ncbi:MAG: hypothetical protein JWP64_2774 [Pseudonocardia sp.]|jgi:hypothetical protein|uniref:DUF1707 SHOCT-like domain-containing protein n=1 Tax=Pseudonocardia sp. TaxID=60912 RepID=UPI0026338053|nr:DUF1707 domain-containing protein [Pseudonocardia sp.]MCU1627825.1 hypothetical protein [Pseudonocardia sp.]MDT7698694.1 hypothetical protein [Pseudonocardiales bacterium]
MGDDHARLRVSDADREAAAQQLNRAMSEGRITLSELEERLGIVYGAKTFAELEPPLADLPGAAVVLPQAAVPVPARELVHLSTEMGSVKRTGDWPVPSRLRLTTSMGSIHLDLTGARTLPRRIDVDVSTGMGSITLVLPEGASADVDGVKTSWGTVKTKVPHTPSGSGPHLTVTGSAGMGTLSIRGARKGMKDWFGA